MNFRRILSGFAAALIFVSAYSPVFAEEPYEGYTYNTYLEKVPAPNAYLPKKVITGDDLGIGQFWGAQDVFVDSQDNIYIMDTINGRVIIMDEDYKLVKVVDKFYKNGELSPLKDAAGIFANPDADMIYICDKGNERVVVCDYDGNIVQEAFKPETDYLSDEIVFAPKKIVVNSIGTMFILSDNINQGMVSIDADGVFQQFFGAERIQLTVEQIAQKYWRKFLTDEQKAQTTTFQPTEYANIFIDSEDFIYTATSLETYTKDQIKRLNPAGTNILPTDVVFGDKTGEFVNGVFTVSAINDITVTDDGFIFALDRNFGRIYMYDEQAWDLAIFGKKDTTFGTFSEPVAIESLGHKILVLDASKANLTVFEPTEYGSYIIDALNYHYLGRYGQALAPWVQVQNLNNNYEWAYAGIGRAQHMTEDYRTAMTNFKKANNQELYSKAKKKFRTQFLRAHFTSVVLSVLFVVFALYYGVKYREIIGNFISTKIKNRKKGGKTK